MNTLARVLSSLMIFAMAHVAAAAEDARPGTPKVHSLLTRALPDIPGKEVSMLTVEYPPGGSSPPHRHQANIFVYVLEGSVIMKVEGGKEVTLSAGETFYESPTDVHVVSRNASATRPAKFLVFSIKEPGTPLSLPVTAHH